MAMCEIRSFPALGFDPTPGNAGAVQEVISKLLTAQVTLGECASRMADALDVSDDWDGDAADDFHDNGDDLPQAFNSGSQSMANAAKALSTWYGQLTCNQQTTEVLEKEAEKAKKDAELMHQQEATAIRHAANAGPHEQAGANAKADTAILRAMAADFAYQQVINRAKALQKRHLQQANQAAEGVKAGEDDSFQPENDGWLVQITDGVSKTTDIVSTVSGTIAAASLVVPVAGEVVAPVAGTVAAGAGAVHTVAAIGQKIEGSKNAPSMAEIAIGAVPTKAVTAPAGALGKQVLRRGEGVALKQGLKQAGKDTVDSTNFAKVVKGIKDMKAARGDDVMARAEAKAATREGLEKKGEALGKHLPGVDRSNYEAIGRWRSAHEAAAGTVDSVDKIHQAADPDYKQSAGDKRTLNGLKAFLNPSVDSLAGWGKSELTDAAKNATHHGK
ncbi:hypothetical protein [Labedaea rhizosphaerae]|uniref:Type VII secretion system (Wss) protein ESAT-6 n=1 Tax=Labedaea rhizosphaerae TaxID=598644 RepID=A0A4R6SC90_LABRH|nr:hypothetical protein [Labedaea rhizosphaerae]TDP97572.1 hypothetical protein EV186_103536 [Labedaea rhizosphaerae]